MLAAGAAHRDGQLALAFFDIERQCHLQKLLIPVQQLLCLRVAHDKIHHFLIQTGLVLERRHIEGVGQAAHVQHQIRLRRQAELEPEGHDGEPHGTLCPAVLQEQVADAFLVLCSREQCRVDGVIGPRPQRLQDLTFLQKCLAGGKPLGNADGMAAAGLAVAAHEHVIRRIQKQDLIGCFLVVQLLQGSLDLFPAAAAAHIHGKRHPLQLVVARLGKRRNTGQQPRRDVIDAEISDILQRIHSHRLSCAGKSADDQQFHLCSTLPLFPQFSGLRGSLFPDRSRSFPLQWRALRRTKPAHRHRWHRPGSPQNRSACRLRRHRHGGNPAGRTGR